MNEQTGNYTWAKEASKLDYSWAKLRKRIEVLEQHPIQTPSCPLPPQPFDRWTPYPPYDITCGVHTK
jgi:hypothetical protein